jgi:hypothetical protein
VLAVVFHCEQLCVCDVLQHHGLAGLGRATIARAGPFDMGRRCRDASVMFSSALIRAEVERLVGISGVSLEQDLVLRLAARRLICRFAVIWRAIWGESSSASSRLLGGFLYRMLYSSPWLIRSRVVGWAKMSARDLSECEHS